jgi:hypothetical protein
MILNVLLCFYFINLFENSIFVVVKFIVTDIPNKFPINYNTGHHKMTLNFIFYLI